MLIEDYVSFETAKLLKEKGFNGLCTAYYDCFTTDNFHCGNEPTDFNSIDTKIRDIVAAPTLQMAMKWLREVHHLTIDVFHFRDWKVNIKTIPDDYFKADYSYPELKPAETHEQACEVAIKYCLENLI